MADPEVAASPRRSRRRLASRPPQPSRAEAAPALQGVEPRLRGAGAEPARNGAGGGVAGLAVAEAAADADRQRAAEVVHLDTAASQARRRAGRPGPAAIAVARQFADAFVLYETGGTTPEVRPPSGDRDARAVPALLRRPPRLPADVEVPQAKVLNVVPGPLHGDIYTLSVSLLRVGVTSELRLDMGER